MALGQIISQIRKKNSGGSYDTFYLGPEQRYSGALPASNNNNLEEQLLMGVDRIIRVWHDNETNTDNKVIEFRRDTDLTDYYILEIAVTGENIISVSGDVIHFDTNMIVYDDILAQAVYSSQMYYDSTTEALVAASTRAQEDHTLYYVQEDGTKLKVSSKHITRSLENDVVVVKEVITNYL